MYGLTEEETAVVGKPEEVQKRVDEWERGRPRRTDLNQYAAESVVESVNLERFQELADQWENETVLLSNSDRAAKHPAHQEIVRMGEPAVPLILKRMQSQSGHWFHALVV